MIRSSLAARVAVAVAALTFLTAGLTTTLAIISTDDEVRGDVDAFLKERSEEILDGTRQPPDRDGRGRNGNGQAGGGDAVDPAVAVPLSPTELDASVQTLDEDGVVTARVGLSIPVTDDDVDLADRKGPDEFRTIEIDGEEFRVITVHIDGGGALQVARSIDQTTSLLDVIRNRLMLVGAALALIAAVIGWFVTRRTLRPLSDLTAAAEQVATTRDLDTPIADADRDDEIGRLAATYNDMIGALATSRDQQHRLVHDAAHELRTPLTSVNANIDLLAHAPDLPADQRQEILGSVRTELRQLGTLFTEIIELATDTHENAEHVAVDLAEIAERAVDDLRRRADNPVTVTATTSVVSGDAPALERAVANLLGNAVKYSPPRSPIVVRVAAGTLTVTDAGPGISAEDRSRVFDRFHRGVDARAQPGSGLGLAIVAKIVDDHGGSVFVDEARPGPGAVVGFRLPN